MTTAKKSTKKTKGTRSATKAKTDPPPPAPTPTPAPPQPGGASQAKGANWRVRIRMYRKWLGDCFLLTFHNGGDEKHVMIDCGALVGTPDAKTKVGEAVKNIAQDTGQELAALVVTHEHWDHVSGFSDAGDAFKEFSNVHAVWAAWTEDPTQTVIKQNIKLRLDAVQTALRSWAASPAIDDQQRGAAVAGLLDFIAPGGLGAAAEKTSAAMKFALSLGRPNYLSPGQVLTDIPGVRVYVLGPPKDVSALHKMMGTVGKQMYGFGLTEGEVATMQALAAAVAAQTDGSAADNFIPFEPYLQWDAGSWAKQFPELANAYNEDPVRKIDRDWLNAAAALALQLDSYTNNTSLVLAFELTDTRDVLLFVGDAQMGNWLSWATMSFSDPDVKASDLLARTIFYKVGHHGSHNATLKTSGLEAMTSPKLVAAIPVDENFARTSKHWDMPAPALYTALQAKTSGRILRSDSDFPVNSPKPSNPPADWAEFQGNVELGPDYIQYYVR